VLGAGGVFRGELHVFDVALGPLHGLHGAAHDLPFLHAQFVLAVDRTGGEEHVDARVLGLFEGFPRAVDVLVAAAGEAANAGAVAEFACDGADGLEVAGGGDGESGLDDVDAEFDQRRGHLQLLGGVHAAAGGLLPVAESGVENDDMVGGGHGAPGGGDGVTRCEYRITNTG
jgi:hypothetical protein